MALTVEEARNILASGNASPELMQEANAVYYGQFTRVSDDAPPPQIGTSPVAPVGIDQSLFRNDLPGTNPLNFATQQTAQQIAAYLGGTVGVDTAAGQGFFSPGTPLALEALNIEIGGVRLNAGLVAVTYQNNPKEVADAIIRANIEGAGGTPPPSFSQTAPSFARQPQSQQTTVDPAPNTFWNGAAWVPQPKPVSSAAPPGPSSAVVNPNDPGTHAGTQPPGATNVVPISGGVGMEQATNIAAEIKAAGIAAMGQNMGTCDEWNWFYTQVTNSPPFSCEQLGYTRDANQQAPRVTFEDWWPRVERLRGGPTQPGAAPGGAGATVANAFGDIRRAISERGLLAIVHMVLAGDAAAPR
jgi:hypothetical protein